MFRVYSHIYSDISLCISLEVVTWGPFMLVEIWYASYPDLNSVLELLGVQMVGTFVYFGHV